LFAVLDFAHDFVVVLDVVTGEWVIEVDACATTDNRLDEPFFALDLDLCAGVAVVFGNLVLADGPNLVVVVLAEGLAGFDDDATRVTDLFADDVVFDRREDVALAENDCSNS
jgi:hypothetical protein